MSRGVWHGHLARGVSWAGRPCHGGCGTGILSVVLHGRDAHVTGRGTGILPVVLHGRDAHVTGGVARASCPWRFMGGTPMSRMSCKPVLRDLIWMLRQQLLYHNRSVTEL